MDIYPLAFNWLKRFLKAPDERFPNKSRRVLLSIGPVFSSPVECRILNNQKTKTRFFPVSFSTNGWLTVNSRLANGSANGVANGWEFLPVNRAPSANGWLTVNSRLANGWLTVNSRLGDGWLTVNSRLAPLYSQFALSFFWPYFESLDLWDLGFSSFLAREKLKSL